MARKLNCDDVFERLTRGPVDLAEAPAVEQHLAECSSCRELAHALQPAVGLIHESLSELDDELPQVRGYVRRRGEADIEGLVRGEWNALIFDAVDFEGAECEQAKCEQAEYEQGERSASSPGNTALGNTTLGNTTLGNTPSNSHPNVATTMETGTGMETGDGVQAPRTDSSHSAHSWLPLVAAVLAGIALFGFNEKPRPGQPGQPPSTAESLRLPESHPSLVHSESGTTLCCVDCHRPNRVESHPSIALLAESCQTCHVLGE